MAFSFAVDSFNDDNDILLNILSTGRFRTMLQYDIIRHILMNIFNPLPYDLSSNSAGVSNLFLQRVSYKFKNVVRAACKKLMIIQTLNDEFKVSLY